MKRFAPFFLSFVFAPAVCAAFTITAFADEIPVNRVILSTSGLANFEHKAKVEGDTALEFPVRLEQVDDILKSLVVFDKEGRLGGVTLPGKQPLAQVFKDLPFSRQQLSSPMMLLNAYQGAIVTLKGENLSITGKIVQVAPENTVTDDKETVKHRISVMTDGGLKQALLEDLQSLQFQDEKVKGEIARALEAIRENSTSERRMLTVNLLGDSSRDVTLSYVVDAPLWKSAYRMVVPETGKDKGLLQGWAVVENMTASDWNDVDLTLVSGNPVTYRQQLYQSYYVDRPEIPVQVFGRVMPRVDQGSIASAKDMERKEEEEYDAPARRGAMMKSLAAPAESMAFADAMGGGTASAAPAAMMMQENVVMGMDAVAQAASAAQSSEATTQVLFRFPDRFTLKSGQSMMLPFVSREVPMERVSLYQPETHPTHPLAAVEIKNDGETGLPPGILTLYEESPLLKGTSFVGDAQLPVVAPDEKRMISYALDSKTTVSREDKSISTEDQISISQGVVRTSVKNRSETTYTVKAPPKESRVVVIEHPKMYDYKIVTPDPKDVEVTDTHYRVKVSVKAGETKTFPVVLENTSWQSYGIDGMPADQLMAYATSRGKLSQETRKAFEALAEMRRSMDEVDAKIWAVEQQRQTIFQDQERVRENLKSLSGKSEIQSKYLDKLSEQEDQIGALDKQKTELSRERQKLQARLQDMIADLKF